MSTITELVEKEAQAAEVESDADLEAGEAEEPGEPEPGEPEPEPEPEEAQPFNPQALERALTRHERAMAKVLGDGWSDMSPCPTCSGAGFMPTGFTPPPDVQTDPDAVVCDACNGYGRRLTGSLAEGSETIPCTPCGGAGWRDARTIAASQQVAAQPPPQFTGSAPPAPVWDAARAVYVDVATGLPLTPTPPLPG